MHPLRTPIGIDEGSDGAVTISGTIPRLASWERISFRDIEQLPRAPGCYALYRAGELIYLGESDNIQERLRGHRKHFDEARWLRVDGFQRVLIEKALIWRFMPAENKEMSRHDWRMRIKEEVMC